MRQICHHENEENPPKTHLGCIRIKHMADYNQRLSFPTLSLIHCHRARPYKGRVDIGIAILAFGWLVSFTPFVGSVEE